MGEQKPALAKVGFFDKAGNLLDPEPVRQHMLLSDARPPGRALKEPTPHEIKELLAQALAELLTQEQLSVGMCWCVAGIYILPALLQRDLARETKLRLNRAIHELTAMYQEAKKAGRLDRLLLDVRFFIEERARAKLPKPPIGRPRDRYHTLKRILVYLKVQEELAKRKPPPRKLTATLKAIAKSLNITADETGGITINSLSYSEVREVFYDNSPEFQDWVAVTAFMRELSKQAREEPCAAEAAADADLS
jgi:hypothetical protein